jgi:hypothetical protein
VYYLGGATTDGEGEYFIDWGCPSCIGFCFHNSFFYGAHAKGYRPIDLFGGRAEYVVGLKIQDFVLTPAGRHPDIPQDRGPGRAP